MLCPLICKDKGIAKVPGKVLHRPLFFKVPVFALKIVLDEFADSITASLSAVPAKLEENNFKFEYSELQSALKKLLK